MARTPVSDTPAATIATTFWCVISTPFGLPVVPDVYISTETSSGPAGVGSHGAALPAASTSSIDTILIPAALSFSAAFASTSPIEMTSLSVDLHASAMLARICSREGGEGGRVGPRRGPAGGGGWTEG